MVYYNQDEQFIQKLVPSIKIAEVVDTTGCGDSFAGALGFSIARTTTDYVTAARYGNAMGAQRAQGRTFEIFKSLQETDAIIAQNYKG
jgi:adenosine kinase